MKQYLLVFYKVLQ